MTIEPTPAERFLRHAADVEASIRGGTVRVHDDGTTEINTTRLNPATVGLLAQGWGYHVSDGWVVAAWAWEPVYRAEVYAGGGAVGGLVLVDCGPTPDICLGV